MMPKQETEPTQGTSRGALCAYVPEGTEHDGILLHPTTPRWVAVNRTTRQIMTRLSATGSGQEDAAAFLVDTYGIPLATARQDVARVVDDLNNQGFLQQVAPEQPRPQLGALYLMLTERCNLACAHCFGSYPTRREMPLPEVLRIIDEFISGGGRSLVLSGGEPLLYPGLEEVVARIGRRIPVQFCTNGMLLDARLAHLFAQALSPSFQVSLDGDTAEIHDAIRGPNAFAGALQGIRHLQEAGLGDRISLATTVHPKNKDRLPELVQLAANLGVSKVRFIPLRAVGRAAETWGCTGQGLDVATYAAIYDRYLRNPQDTPAVEVKCGLSGFSLAGGIPMGAVLCTEEVARSFHPGMHGTTFGGGPLACAVAIAVIGEIEKTGLLAHATEVGDYFQEQLRGLAKRHEAIVDVRGKGLMVAAELDSAELAKLAVAEMLKRRILINCTSETVLRFLPPYILERSHVDTTIAALDEIFTEYAAAQGAAATAGGHTRG